MSVLDLPRLNFSGEALWNPDTANNSPGVYDENSLQQNPAIAPADFVSWLTSLSKTPPPGQQALNGSWNTYGDQGCWFRNTKIVGVQSGYGKSTNNDPICTDPGILLQMVGQSFSDGGTPPARMVDVAPYQSTTTQLFLKWLQLGTNQFGFRADVASRMYLRWSMLRNIDFADLPIAGVAGVIFQTAALAKDVQWFGVAKSPALQALQKAANASPNQGIVIQFAVYRTQYYKNASFKGKPIANANDLAAAYAAGFKGPNPAQSLITGTIGVWGPNELATAPTQLLLNPMAAVSAPAPPLPSARAVQEGMVAAKAQAPQPFPLGPAVAKLYPGQPPTYAGANLAVSFVTTILETNLVPEKENLGPLTLQVADGSGKPLSTIATIPYQAYARASYLNTSGILDFPLTADQVKLIQNPANILQLSVLQQGKPVIALQQTPFVVETDQRGVYLDQNEITTMTASVYQNGQPAGNSVKVLVAQYYEVPQDTNPNNPFPYVLVTTTNQAKACLTLNGQPIQTIVPVSNGKITFPIKSVNPGTAMLGFFPFTGNTPPTPPGGPGSTFPAQTTSYYAVIRCLGFDNALLSLPDSQVNWKNTYEKVLQVYNLVYPEMSRIRDLSDLNVVKGMAEQILAATKYPGNFEWTMFMPVTREMSAGKRNLLQRFCTKVLNNEPV
jgi:hypothetical protein